MINEDASVFQWEKKIVKIHKALTVMEKQKYLNPHFSLSFGDLAQHLLTTLVTIITCVILKEGKEQCAK
jgi:hypothetical protein